MRTIISEITIDKKWQPQALSLLPTIANIGIIGIIFRPILGGLLSDLAGTLSQHLRESLLSYQVSLCTAEYRKFCLRPLHGRFRMVRLGRNSRLS
jgi:hypothetical protein